MGPPTAAARMVPTSLTECRAAGPAVDLEADVLQLMAAQLFGHLSCIRERAMVHFNAAAQEQYATLFRAFLPLVFMRLMRLAQWRDIAPAARLPRSGQDLAHVILIYNGAAEVRQANVNRRPLRDGAFVGETSFLRGGPAPADVTVTVPTRLVQ